MLKYLTILLGLVFTTRGINLLQAQETAKVEIPLYFEDIFGNKDTLIIGYDPNTSYNEWNVKPEFGEVPLTEPFDSVFEVRLYKTASIITSNGLDIELSQTSPYLKKAIANSYNEEDCGGVQDLWLTGNVKGGFLKVTSPVAPYNPDTCINYGIWFLNNGIYFAIATDSTLDAHFDCLAWEDSINMDYAAMLEQVEGYSFRRIIEIEDGTMDTVQAFNLGITRHPGFMPSWDCKFPLPTNIDSTKVGLTSQLLRPISIAPNPTNGLLQFYGLEHYHHVSIVCYDSNGNKVLSEPISNNSIDVSNWSKGLYLYHLFEDGQPLQSGKFQKH